MRLLAETFADPVTASDWALAQLDHEIEQLRNTDEDALIIRTAIAGFYADRLRGCREALFRVVRDGREGGAVGSGMMALSMLAYDDLYAGRWDEALELVAEATAMWEERGYRLYAWAGLYAMALIAGNRGDREACRRPLRGDDRVGRAAPARTPRGLGEPRARQAALGAGDFEESLRPRHRHQPARDARGPTTPRRCGPRWT